MTTSSGTSDEKSREVRLGLVLYGGVSLAIYMNGVAHEVFRAVKGQGIYKLIKAFTDSDIVVDIISGTSAGGINGIMLAYALCNDRDFSPCADLWRRDGDIRALLRSPNQAPENTHSVLDSEGYFQPRLEDVFRKMPEYHEDGKNKEDPSDFRELDLFVTGTDVDGKVFTAFDDCGHPIDVKDHRAVFQLKHRKGRKEPFKTDSASEVTFQALAKLSRITSCFPAAFAPVHVTNMAVGDDIPDSRLQLWGQIRKETYFVDGGVLNNKPFTTTLREIFYRMADRPVERFLLYVEPDPERFDNNQAVKEPKFLEVIFDSLVSIPGYQSISGDLQLLAQHNNEAELYNRVVASLRNKAPRPDYTTEQVYFNSRLVFISQRAVRGVLREGGLDTLLNRGEQKAAAKLGEEFDRLVSLNETISLQENGDKPPREPQLLRDYDVYYRSRRLFHISAFLRDLQRSDKNDNYRKLRYILGRQIELLEIVQAAMEKLIDEAAIEWKVKLGPGESGQIPASESGALPEWIDPNGNDKWTLRDPAAIWKDVQSAFEQLMKDDNSAPSPFPDGYEDAQVLEGWQNKELREIKNIWLIQTQLKDFSSQMAGRAKKVVAEVSEGTLGSPQNLPTLFRLTDACEKAIFNVLAGSEMGQIKTAYESFENLDAHLYPMELLSGLHSKNIINTVRISPLDAKKGFSNKGLSEKVAGKALYHFGGFFKRSWRSNDILWGRLDTVCQLIETLVSTEKLKTTLADREILAKLDSRIKTDLLPEKLFRHAPKATHEKLSQWYEQLTCLAKDLAVIEEEVKQPEADKSLKSEEEKKAAIDGKKLELQGKYAKFQQCSTEYVELLIEAAQLEILFEDVPNVITDSVEEQAEWNQFLVSVSTREKELASPDNLPRYDPENAVFIAGKGNLDRAVVTVAAEANARQGLATLLKSDGSASANPKATPMGIFFDKKYRVGSEGIEKDVPSLILLEIISTAALVLRNCILGSFGKIADKIRKNRAYTFGLDYPLQAFHTLVQFLRRAPTQWRAIQVGLAILSVLALVVGINWWSEIIYPEKGHFALRWFLVFTFFPAFLLLAQAMFLWRGRAEDIRPRRILSDLAWAMMALLSLLSIIACVSGSYEFVQRGVAQWVESILGSPPVANVGGWVAVVTLYGVLPLVLPFWAGAWAARVAQGRSVVKPRYLKKILKKYFAQEQLIQLAGRLSIRNLPVGMNQSGLAVYIFKEALKTKPAIVLERQMRSINPDALG